MRKQNVVLAYSLMLGLAFLAGETVLGSPADAVGAGWQAGNVVEASGLRATLSKPVLVGRSKGYLWFPTVVRLSSGDLMAVMSDHADIHVSLSESTAKAACSSDGGLTWGPLAKAFYGDGTLALPNGDQLFMPYYLRPAGSGTMQSPYQLCPKGQRNLKVVSPGLTVEGWPRPDKSFDPKLGLSGFVCNGQVVTLKDRSYLATLYGHFRDTSRYSLVASESTDGVRWRIRSVIADEKCELPGREGPCESAVARLKDGRLLCVFRLDSGVPYGHSFSGDEGRTWTKPTLLKGCFSVQPSLAVLPDGLVALSGGRPGLFLWLNTDGKAATWHKIDVLANHNAHRPEEPIKGPGNTSSYTEVIPLDRSHLLYIYDRIPSGWSAIPRESSETNSVWVVRIAIATQTSEVSKTSEVLGTPSAGDRVPGVAIDHSPAASGIYIGSPSIAILPGGEYVASHDLFGPKTTEHQRAVTRVFRSADKGQTWKHQADIHGQFWSSLFVHRGELYILGTLAHYNNTVIRRSADGGRTWTEPKDANTGLLLAGRYHCAPVPVIVHEGRLWRAMEETTNPRRWGISFRALVMSAPADADLLRAESWTCSDRLSGDANWLDGKFNGWLEGNAVATPEGRIVDILRVDCPQGGKAAVVEIGKEGRSAAFDPAAGWIDFPGGAKKFTVRYDAKSNRYWSLTNYIPPKHQGRRAGGVRNTLALTSSADLRQWKVNCILLYHPDVTRHAFQYPDWQLDGEDIIAAIRTAYDDGLGGAHNAHDANYLTFHRFRDFRRLTPADSVVNPKHLGMEE